MFYSAFLLRGVDVKSFYAILCLSSLLLVGCQDPTAFSSAAGPKQKPVPPLELSPPDAPAATFRGRDLSDIDSRELTAGARDQIGMSNYPGAVQLQYWSVANGPGDEGLYDLACYYSLNGEVEAGFYWLQRAAAEEGVDYDWAQDDGDLKNLRQDRRWKKVDDYLASFNGYWEHSGHTETTLVVPAGYEGKTPIPVLIGLHGMGSRAKDFVTDEAYQQTADELQIALVGVSGTVPRGPKSFVWSEDPKRDLNHIQAALAAYKNRLTPAPGKLMLFGFSQGGKMSVEIAARSPKQFSGALAMSPGGSKNAGTGGLQADPAHKLQHYIIVCNAGEHPGNVELTSNYAEDMRDLGANVEHKAYPGVSEHTLPPDYWDRIDGWIQQMHQ